MKHAWTFGQQMMTPLLGGRAIKETLIEYDGPQLVLLEKATDQFLSLRIDEDESGVRWLQSPVTTVELEALMSGELPLRNAFLKAELLLVENSHDEEPVHAWQLDPATIPDKVLPKRDAPLPEYVRSSYRSDLSAEAPAELHVGAKGMQSNQITFSRLSSVTATIQSLWNSLATTMGNAQLTLNAIALAPGSLKIVVEVTDRPLLARVASAYQLLTRAAYDENRLHTVLSTLPEPVQQNFSQYLRALDLNQLDVLIHWREEAGERTAFVGYAAAGRTRKSIRGPQAGEVTRTPLTLNGSFEGFARQKKIFEFYVLNSGKLLTGKIHKSLRDVPLYDGVLLDRRRKYRAEIELTVKDGEEKYTLLAFSPLD